MQISFSPNYPLIMKQKNIKGYIVLYKDDAEKGVEHLAYILSFDEAESLFRSAKNIGKVKFEDRGGRNFLLISKFDGTFVVEKRPDSWF